MTDGVQSEIDQIDATMREIQERLEDLQKKLKEQKHMEAVEDKNAEKLRKWCIRVRSFVLIPSTDDLRENARPPLDGNISKIMESVLLEAETFGIASLYDVASMRNLFHCMSWSLLGLSVINRKPTLEEMEVLISKATDLRLPDEKALKTMKLMAHRAEQVKLKIEKVLATRPGESKPVKQSVLNELVASTESVALIIPESRRIFATIENKGIPPDASDEESNSTGLVNRGCKSPHGHDPKKLWPPFALFGSPEVIELLGPECSLIPQDTSVINPEESTVSSDQLKDYKLQMESQPQTSSQPTEVTSTEKSVSSLAVQSEGQNESETEAEAEAVQLEMESSVSVAASNGSDTPMKVAADVHRIESQLSGKEERPVASAAENEPMQQVETIATSPEEVGEASELEKPAEPESETEETEPVVPSVASSPPETQEPIDSSRGAEVSSTEVTSTVTQSAAATVASSQTGDCEMTDVQASDVGDTGATEEVPIGTTTSSEISSVTTGGASVASANESPRGVTAKEEGVKEDPQESSTPDSESEGVGAGNTSDAVNEVAIATARDRLITAIEEAPIASAGDPAVAAAKERLIDAMQEVPISSTEMQIDATQETQEIKSTVSMDAENTN